LKRLTHSKATKPLASFCLIAVCVIGGFIAASDAQERFFTSPNRGGAEGAREAVQLQQETNRNITQDISLTALAGDLATAQATTATSLTALQSTMNVSLSTAIDHSCGNAGMMRGPSHTIAVGGCVPSLTLNPQGNTVLTGGLQLGSVGNCEAGMAGMLRYQAAQRTVQFCDGTAWQEVGAAPVASGNFTAASGVNPSTVVTSNAITISGFAGARTATVTPGATIVVNGTAIGAAATVNPGDNVALRVQSSGSFDSTVNVTFTISSLVSTWTVTTRAQDTSPNAFTFAAASNQAVNTQVTSAYASLTGFDAPLTISVSGPGGPQLQLNSGAWASSASANPGDNVRVRLTTANAAAITFGASVTLGSHTTNWTVTTESYAWLADAWGACSASCGGGTQSRTVNCRGQSTSATGPAGWCTGVQPATSQSCNTQACCTWQWQNYSCNCQTTCTPTAYCCVYGGFWQYGVFWTTCDGICAGPDSCSTSCDTCSGEFCV
jgi:hypothetical protein